MIELLLHVRPRTFHPALVHSGIKKENTRKKNGTTVLEVIRSTETKLDL